MFEAETADVIEIKVAEVVSFGQNAGGFVSAEQNAIGMRHAENLAINKPNFKWPEGSLSKGIHDVFCFHLQSSI